VIPPSIATPEAPRAISCALQYIGHNDASQAPARFALKPDKYF